MHRHPAPVFFRAFFSVAFCVAPGPQRGESCCLRASAVCISPFPQSLVAPVPTVLLRFRSPLGLTPITSPQHAWRHAVKRRKICPDSSPRRRSAGPQSAVGQPPHKAIKKTGMEQNTHPHSAIQKRPHGEGSQESPLRSTASTFLDPKGRHQWGFTGSAPLFRYTDRTGAFCRCLTVVSTYSLKGISRGHGEPRRYVRSP